MSNLKFDEFVFKGVNCNQFKIHAIGQPIYTRPSIRASQVAIPGRSGALTLTEGDDIFEATAFSVSCIIDDADRLDQIAAFYKGQGDVEFYSLPGGKYKNAWVVNQIPFAKIVRGNPHRSFSLEFQCPDPYFYLDYTPISVSGNSVTFYPIIDMAHSPRQMGNIDCRPVFKFDTWGTAGDKVDIEVTENGTANVVMSFQLPVTATQTSPIHCQIDNQLMYAYGTLPGSEATVPLTGYLSGDWIKMHPSTTQNIVVKLRYYNSAGEVVTNPPVKFTLFQPNWRRI